MTDTLGSRVRPRLHIDFADDLERRAFDGVRRERTFEGVAAVGFAQVLVLLVFWPTDFVVESSVARRLAYFRAVIVGLWGVVWFAARLPAVRRHISFIVFPYVAASALATVWLGPATTLDAAWVDVCIIVPMFCAVLIQPLGVRVLTTLGVSLGFVAIYFALRPDQLGNPHIGSFATSLTVATAGSVAVGHIYTLLVHQQFVRSRALARKNGQLEGVVRERTSELEELTERLKALQDEERRAVELELSSRARAFMNSCRKELSLARTTNATVKAALERMTGLLDTLDLQLKEALGGDHGDIDLHTRIGRTVATARPSTDAEILLRSEGGADALSAPVRNALFRMYQEAFTNALKHSRATRISVGLARQAGGIVVTIADNGIGIEAGRQGPQRGTGIGLDSLRQRAAELGAKLSIASSQSDGTVVTIAYDTVPTAPQSSALGGRSK